jgi:GIY-YIG catalytic domain
VKISKNHKSTHSASVQKWGTKVRIEFTPAIPEGPGVYRVILKNSNKTFYCGEASRVSQRLKFLFRCNPGKNPHPCHKNYSTAFGMGVEPWTFCKKFKVEIISTIGAMGRLEIEEQLKNQYGTNKKSFYKAWIK